MSAVLERCNDNAHLRHRATVMSTPQTRTHQAQGHEVGSLRSRASSVVSTGTKFSISTLPNDEHLQIDSLLDRPRHSIAFRPRSVFSAISYDQSLPPYEPYDETHSGDIVLICPIIIIANSIQNPLPQRTKVSRRPDHRQMTQKML